MKQTPEHFPLGQEVTVVVDRPLGSFHPQHPDLYYPVNYGYIPGLFAPDSEEQDAYILGVTEPVARFTGRVIAIIRRKNDIENKWVVAPAGASFSEAQIRAATDFQERFFEIEIEMILSF